MLIQDREAKAPPFHQPQAVALGMIATGAFVEVQTKTYNVDRSPERNLNPSTEWQLIVEDDKPMIQARCTSCLAEGNWQINLSQLNQVNNLRFQQQGGCRGGCELFPKSVITAYRDAREAWELPRRKRVEQAAAKRERLEEIQRQTAVVEPPRRKQWNIAT